MNATPVTTVFFDLGDTLGTPKLSPEPVHLTGFNVFDWAWDALVELRSRKLRLGIISNTGDDPAAVVDPALRVPVPAGKLPPGSGVDSFVDFFAAPLRIYSKDVGHRKDSRVIFDLSAGKAGAGAAACMFVGEDVQERAFAREAGMRTSPHPLLVTEVLDGQPLRYVRVTVPPGHPGETLEQWKATLLAERVVPLQVSGPGGKSVIAIASQRTVTRLVQMQFGVELLGAVDAPQHTDLYMLRDDHAADTGFLDAQGETEGFFASAETAGLLVGAADGGILVALPAGYTPDNFHFPSARHGHTEKLVPDPLLLAPSPSGAASFAAFAPAAGPTLEPAEFRQLQEISGAALLDRVERYSGKKPPAPGQAPIASRHIAHPDNARAVAAAAKELQELAGGRLTVRLIPFTFNGLDLRNVEAELPGDSPALVLVTAHLDSTAMDSLPDDGSNRPYDPRKDAAPGADDDGSGLAAVLTIAECFLAMTAGKTLPHTVRFVLFNAEEQGLVGSKVYARDQRSAGAQIAGVFQMDMIGYNGTPPPSWEVHAGFSPSPVVEERSVRLAERLLDVCALVSPDLQVPQIYRSTLPGGDGAEGRSDHAPFQARGYPACVASEDFFTGPGPADPVADENPHYHQKGDTLVDEKFAADITRVVAAAAYLAARAPAPPGGHAAFLAAPSEGPREVDTRRSGAGRRAAAFALAAPAAPPAPSLLDRAVAFLQQDTVGFGAALLVPEAAAPTELVPDPVVQRTSSGGAAVHVHQFYHGLPVFQMARTVRFAPDSRPVDAAGDSVDLPPGLEIEPQLNAAGAVRRAAEHLAGSRGAARHSEFGNVEEPPRIDIGDFQPRVLSAFALPTRPTVVEKGPFEDVIPAHLVVFAHPAGARLAWHVVLTFPGHVDKYVVLISADDNPGEVLYCRSVMTNVRSRGRVWEFSPGAAAERRLLEFPRPLADYPVTPAAPIAGFPADWIDGEEAAGNTARATLGETSTRLHGRVEDGVTVFDPAEPQGDEQKILNIFYFCSYMHDFLFLLGFDEAAGNFQEVNFTHLGSELDPVDCRSFSGPVFGTANMDTFPDGTPPVMNMGLVAGIGRHTAFDADVVFHEYTHGLTNRLVGGPMNTGALEATQSGGMGEGWSDYYALTIQNFFLPADAEKVTTGTWVINNPAGIRRAPYDDDYPFSYGDIPRFDQDPDTGEPEVHDVGEVWCAALMMMTRKIRRALGDDAAGYRLSWQMVTDGLKLTPANPSFLEARDAILLALDQLRDAGRVTAPVHKGVRRAAWEAFARFEMGVHASSTDAGGFSITGDTTLPDDLE